MRKFEEKILIEGELIDTYGGDFTYRDVSYYVDENDNYHFSEFIYGAKKENHDIDDPNEIRELINLIEQKNV